MSQAHLPAVAPYDPEKLFWRPRVTKHGKHYENPQGDKIYVRKAGGFYVRVRGQYLKSLWDEAGQVRRVFDRFGRACMAATEARLSA